MSFILIEIVLFLKNYNKIYNISEWNNIIYINKIYLINKSLNSENY